MFSAIAAVVVANLIMVAYVIMAMAEEVPSYEPLQMQDIPLKPAVNAASKANVQPGFGGGKIKRS